ncbi:Hypothetical protein A7982_07343 [Minicystis rosea]|nr:Hypothetical protein A7982_07343 [Minicystis rosea]
MAFRTLLSGAVGAWALAACNPNLPYRPGGDDPLLGGGGAGGAELVVTAEPPAPLDAIPPVTRLRIETSAPLDPTLVSLVQGEVGPGHLRQLAERDPSKALAERILSSVVFRDGAALIVAPTIMLEPGERYSLALAELRQALPIHVTSTDTIPLLRRLWPPEDAIAVQPTAVWCGEDPLPAIEALVDLVPEGPRGRIVRGAAPGGAGQRCLRFESGSDVMAGGAWVPPPVVMGPDLAVMARLEPGLVRVGEKGTEVPALACDADEIALGPGCARVLDDRVLGRSPAVPLLWAVAGAGVDSVLTTRAGDPFVITGLPPATEVMLDVSATDARGTVLRMLVSAVTTTPMPHVVLNEILANPLGPEPASEWVEIVNDGQIPVELKGYAIVDGGGETVLPTATLAPGAFALVVNDGFDEKVCIDPCPAPGTLILRVPHLGKNGLSNAGEPIGLRDENGVIVSQLPIAPKPKPGKSVARRAPALSDSSESFAIADPSPGRSNVF